VSKPVVQQAKVQAKVLVKMQAKVLVKMWAKVQATTCSMLRRPCELLACSMLHARDGLQVPDAVSMVPICVSGI
jgi:hypothetical protein